MRRLEGLAGIEFRSGVAVREPYPRHWHEEYQFCFIQAGGGELFYRGASHDTPATSLFVVHPGEVHSNHTETGCSFRSVYVAPELVQSLMSGEEGAGRFLPFFPNPLVFDREVIAPYLRLHLSAESACTTLEREAALLEMLGRLVGRYAQGRPRLRAAGREHVAVRKAREYIVEHHARNVSLQELSRLTNLSPFHLNHVFTREVGMPPHAFHIQARVACAKKLIRERWPLAAVAAMTGFADQSHLIRHFKRLLKITPGEYLKTAKTSNTELGL